MSIKIVVPLSGGKDSQATLKLALQNYDPSEIIGLFCDTQFEHPLTYRHIEKLRTLYGNIRIDTVCAGSVEQQSLKHRRFPGGGARFCTEELKIRPTKRYCKALATELGHGFEVWYGMRSDESSERNKRYAGKICDELYAPHEVMSKYPKYLEKLGVMFRLAILDWTELDVFEWLQGEHNPLYNENFDRVGCFPCLASGDKAKEKAFGHDAFGQDQYQRVLWISSQINKSIWTSKGGKERNEEDKFTGCAICSI